MCDLKKLRWGFLGALNTKIKGKAQTPTDQQEVVNRAQRGEYDVLIVSVESGKAGLNLQMMRWMVSLYPISRASDYEQAKGEIFP